MPINTFSHINNSIVEHSFFIKRNGITEEYYLGYYYQVLTRGWTLTNNYPKLQEILIVIEESKLSKLSLRAHPSEKCTLDIYLFNE